MSCSIDPPGAGQGGWTETVLQSFDGADGKNPYGRLLADGAGHLYGTTWAGGKRDGGVVFELSPPAAGQTAWTETVLLSFDGTDGEGPYAGLLADGAGDLYGTTGTGGANGDGVVFELTPPAAGQTAWTETVLQSFDGADGAYSYAGLLADGAGDLYGTTYAGGANNEGVVFELSPPKAPHTAWAERVLQSFDGADGETLIGGLIADRAGALYGTTQQGGANDEGVVFELTH